MQQRTITMLAQQRLRTMEQRHAQQLQSLERSLLAAAVPKPEVKKRCWHSKTNAHGRLQRPRRN
jgi:hypothetical protein